MVRQKLRRWALMSVAIFVSAYGLLVATPAVVHADGKDGSFISQELSGKVLDHQLYYYMASCFRANGIDSIPKEELLDWRWLKQSRLAGVKESRWRGAMYENNKVNCEDGQWLKEAFGRFGFTDPLVTFCSLDFAYNRSTGGLGKTVNGGDSKEACISGLDSGDFDGSDGSDEEDYQGDSVDKLLASSPKKSTYNAAKAPLANEAEYLRYYRTFMRGCGVTLTQPYTEGAGGDGSDKAYQVRVVNQDGTDEDWLGSGEYSGGHTVEYVSTLGEDPKTISCNQLVQGIRDHADDYAKYLRNEGATDDPVDAGGTDTGADEPVCSAGALGWVLCPLSEAMVGAIEGIAGVLKSLLIYQPLLTSDQGKAIRSIWQSLLVIANVGLALAILIIVFSQATSVGLSSYGIKKLLPRVIAAAILMNLSFYICAAAVDISNILGVSIKSIVEAGMNQITGISSLDPDLQVGADATDWFITITATVFAAAIAFATGAIFLLLPVLAAGVIALLTALLIIAARQVLITLLIIVAPLAFLAWILPNTEEWFTRWRKLFIALLLMFPLIMIIFYGSVLMSSVIMVAGTNTGNGVNNFTITILAFLVLVVPLFSLPFVMKSVGGILERFGAITNNRGRGLVDRTRRKSDEWKGRTSYQRGSELRRRARDEYRGTKFANRVGRGGVHGALARGVGGNIGRIPGAKDTIYGAQANRLGDFAVSAERKAASERRQSIVAGLRSEGIDMNRLQQRYFESVRNGDVDAANAQLSHLATTYGSGGRKLAAEALDRTDLGVISDTGKREKMRTELNETIGSDLYGSLIGSRADIAKGGFRTDTDANGNIIAGSDNRFTFTDISKLTAPQIAGQDEGVHEMGARRGQEYKADEAYIAMTNPELISKISDSGTRQELSRLSGVPIRATAPPPPAGGGPTPPTPPPSGGGGGTP